MSFSQVFNPDQIENQRRYLDTVQTTDVERVLNQSEFRLQDFGVLVAPAAQAYLETMAQKARFITQQRFGHTMQIYIPLYLSNECTNACQYCGFSVRHRYERKTLTLSEIKTEYQTLADRGYRHILLLTGESRQAAGMDYLSEAVALAAQYFASVGLEIYPLATAEYQQLIDLGADSLTIYQETYCPTVYAQYHLSGQKADFQYRLETPDRGGVAGFYRLNIGVLLGLYDWRYEALALAQHVAYLEKKYWQTKLGISFPRIKKIVGGFTPPYEVTDTELVQYICAFRLVFPDIGISLSTRETPQLRDQLIHLGVTQYSAESQTNPGGYSGSNSEQQFEISDHRSMNEIRTVLQQQGFDVVMKDWELFTQSGMA